MGFWMTHQPHLAKSDSSGFKPGCGTETLVVLVGNLCLHADVDSAISSGEKRQTPWWGLLGGNGQ